MLEPQITLQGVDASDNLEEVIHKKVAKLTQYYDRINSCRVVVEAEQRHKHQGKLFNVRVELTVPGRKQLVASHKQDEDIYVALRDAFDALIRQLEEHGRKRHGEVKAHAEYVLGRVAKLFKNDDYGFIEGADGTEYYFSVTNVHYPSFDQLMIGDEVQFTPEALDDGWQAHHIIKGKHHGPESY